MANRLQIAPRHRRILEALLREHLPGVEVWAYGSRVNGHGHSGSDLDLALRAPNLQKLPAGQLSDFEDAVRESGIPFLVEGHDWARLPERFHGEIERDYVVVSESATQGPERHATATAPHWERRDVRDLIQDGVLVVGDGYRAKNSELSGNGVPFARAGNVADGFRFAGADRFPGDGLHKVGDKTSRPGDVVFTSKGTVGRFAFVRGDTEHFVYSPQLCFWRSLDRTTIDPYFLYCWMRGPEFFGQFKGVAGQTDMAEYVSLTDQRRMFVTLPPLDEQHAIAHVLGTLDDKIELNRRMNATLEAMARALFRSWFVDFDPVRAKMEDRDTGLPEEVADLFPDRLVESELGEIPESWEVSEIGSEVKAVGGATPSTKEPVYWNGGQHCWATPKDLSKLPSPALLGTDRRITDAGLRKISSGLLPRGTVLLSSRAPIGYLAIAEVPTAVNQGFIAMICQKRLPALYVLSWCHENLERIKDVSGGSTFAEISKQTFRPLSVVVPPESVLGVYDETSRSLHDRVVSNTRESGLLASLRDALLPKLVSGELRVEGLELPNGHDDLQAAVEAHGA